jgi:hypothetical protein
VDASASSPHGFSVAVVLITVVIILGFIGAAWFSWLQFQRLRRWTLAKLIKYYGDETISKNAGWVFFIQILLLVSTVASFASSGGALAHSRNHPELSWLIPCFILLTLAFILADVFVSDLLKYAQTLGKGPK